jgi:glycosyltransferase involved in cell wall biosynthesis
MSRLRINWFSPLPPRRTGIADYTAFLLPTMLQACDVTLWTDQNEWDPGLDRITRVSRYDPDDPPWRELHRGDLCLYHIGNNAACHGNILKMSRRLPGLVEVHDLCLHEMFAGLYRELWDDRTGYIRLMERWYGAAGRADAESFWSGKCNAADLSERYPLTQAVIEGALGVVVHTQQAVEVLSKTPGCPVLFTPLPRAVQRNLPRFLSYERKRLSSFRLLVFGHIGANRRLEQFLHAWGTLPKTARDSFKLDVCGEIWDLEIINRAIRAHGLEGHVELHGYVSEQELIRFVRSAHLAINLRFPTMGEASGSQLFLWEFGVPSVVTRVGWYATLPEQVAAFVNPGAERADIQRILLAFLDAPSTFAEIGEAGRRLLHSQHSAQGYVKSLCDFAAESIASNQFRVANYLAQRAGEAMSPWSAHLAGRTPYFSTAREIQDISFGPRREAGKPDEPNRGE